MLAFLSITTFAVLAAVAAVYGLVKIGGAIDLITKKRVPVALIAQDLSREAERLVAVGPAMLSSTTLDEQELLSEEMYAVSDRVVELLDNLQQTGIDPASIDSIKLLTELISTHAISLDGIFMNNITYLERKESALVKLTSLQDVIQELLTSKAKVERARVF